MSRPPRVTSPSKHRRDVSAAGTTIRPMSAQRYTWTIGDTTCVDDRDWSEMSADEFADALMDNYLAQEDALDREALDFDDPDHDPEVFALDVELDDPDADPDVFELLTTTETPRLGTA